MKASISRRYIPLVLFAVALSVGLTVMLLLRPPAEDRPLKVSGPPMHISAEEMVPPAKQQTEISTSKSEESSPPENGQPLPEEAYLSYYRSTTIPYGVAGENFLMNVALTDGSDEKAMPEDPAFRIKAAMQVDEETAQKVAAYAQEALKSIAASIPERIQEQCARRSSISSIRALAEAMEEMDRAHELLKVDLIRGIEGIAGQDAMRNLDIYLDQSAKMMSYKSGELEKDILQSGRTVEEILQRMCDSA